MTTLRDFPLVPAFGHQPTPPGVDVVGVDLPIGRLTAYRIVPEGVSRGIVLIVPGYTGSKEDWRIFLPHLRALGWSAIVISRRGQADSVASEDPDAYSLEAEAADVVRVARLLDDGAPVHLVGHSLGGVIVRAAAIQDPGAFRDVTMLCSGPYGWRYRKAAERTIVTETGSLLAMFDAQNPYWAGRPDAELDDDARFVRNRFRFTSPLSVLAGADILEDGTDRTPELLATGLPTLVAHGVWDGAWPIPWQRAMAERLGADYEVIPESYHGPQIENPVPTAAVIDHFMAKH